MDLTLLKRISCSFSCQTDLTLVEKKIYIHIYKYYLPLHKRQAKKGEKYQKKTNKTTLLLYIHRSVVFKIFLFIIFPDIITLEYGCFTLKINRVLCTVTVSQVVFMFHFLYDFYKIFILLNLKTPFHENFFFIDTYSSSVHMPPHLVNIRKQ